MATTKQQITYKHFKLEKDQDKILWLTVDRADSRVNSLNRELIDELDLILEEVSKDASINAMIIRSGKQHGFIAGADITQFTKLKSVDEAFELVRQAQIVFDKLEALKIPTVAMIDGFCLGGGAELALACRYRVIEETSRIGLPEVKLGLHPGWGGTIRLVRNIGPIKAIPLILAGTALEGSAAKKTGFVDDAVPRRQLERAARYFALNKPPVQKPDLIGQIANHPLARPLLAKKFYAELAKKAKKEHYPAPYKVIHYWQQDGAQGEQAYIHEARSISELFIDETSRNLIRVFFLQERMKGLAKGVEFKPKHIHVIGAGVMGGDIAAWCALRGLNVTLQDRSAELIAPAIKRAHELYSKKLKKPRLVQAAMDRLMADPDGAGVRKADVVIEAIFENKEAKQALYKTLEPKLKPGAVLATNTSSLPLDELNQVLKHPERLVGIHFFNPVAMMQLVEVVQGEKTNPDMINKAMAFVRAIDRLPLPVKSSPGFLVNRVLMPYLMEAMVLFEEGVPPALIDKAATDFGMPMGPIELADAVGLDICLHVAEILSQHLGGQVPDRLRKMVDQKQLGRKTGKGFYDYKNGKPIKPAASPGNYSMADITDRLILRMVNENVACLREKVVADADLSDAGMIFGTGFAPFRGGPINYAKTRSIEATRNRLDELTRLFGDRFKPDNGWEEEKQAAHIATAE